MLVLAQFEFSGCLDGPRVAYPLPFPKPFPKSNPVVPLKHGRYPEAMTIAFGLLAGDGVVLAADTEIGMPDYLKAPRGKVAGAQFGPGENGKGAICVAGSGNLHYVERVRVDIFRGFYNSKSIAEMATYLQQYLGHFYQNHVVPFASYPAAERPDFNLLVAAQIDGKVALWSTEKNSVRLCPDWDAIGIGAMYAHVVIARDFPKPRTIKMGVLLAAYALMQVKASIPGCGNESTIWWLQDNRFKCIAAREIEDLF